MGDLVKRQCPRCGEQYNDVADAATKPTLVQRLYARGEGEAAARIEALEGALREMVDEAFDTGVGKGANVFDGNVWKRARVVLEDK